MESTAEMADAVDGDRDGDELSRERIRTLGEMRETEYHWNDFEWEELRREIEGSPSFGYHLLPSPSSTSSTSRDSSPSQDSQAWNNFHIRHSAGNFFKERRYLLKEFPELVCDGRISKVLEVGCGSGSSALPILRANESIIVYACDCSTEALQMAKVTMSSHNIVSFEQRFYPFCCDFAISPFPEWLACCSCRKIPMQSHTEISDSKECSRRESNGLHSPGDGDCCIGGVHFVSLIFTLSAVAPRMMPRAVNECFSVLKPGGLLLFRDYGLYDMAMLRFDERKRVGLREYLRCDGTRSYFFSLNTVRDLFVGAGFIVVEVDFCCVRALNRRNGKSMRRVWIHGKFKKPISS